jgi:(E)-4-hydroxy-3-methylbut-2-enyl-diphosphate synthase
VRVAFLALRAAGAPHAALAPAPDAAFDAELLPPHEGAPADGPQHPLRLLTPAQAGRAAARPDGAPPLILLEAAEVDGPHLAALLREGRAFPRGALLLLRGAHPLHPLRRLVQHLAAAGLDWPLGVLVPPGPHGTLPLGVVAQIGSLAADGLLDAIVAPDADPAGPMAETCRTLLQAARLRTYKTEYISCPSCGRTLFDLEETTARIKARTRHLKGVRIGIMGCIVNGPGEMADADFGYVGGAPGKVNLYKGQTCLVRGVPTAQAVERLVALIQEHGAWVEP